MHSTSSREELLKQFTLPLEVTIRVCRRSDLANLEWYGMFTPHREIIREAYRRQEAGENLMLVAQMNSFPAGQVWIDLEKKGSEGVGFIWALRVYPFLQGLGIGRRLMRAAEEALRRRSFTAAELGVEKGNDVAPFYTRLGYEAAGPFVDEHAYRTPEGAEIHVRSEQTAYRKQLGPDL